jgi:hypothetical protein
MRTGNWVCFSEESVRGSGSPVVFRAVLDFPWGDTHAKGLRSVCTACP